MRAAIEHLSAYASTEVLPTDLSERAQVRRHADGLPSATSVQRELPYFGDSHEALMSQKAALPGEVVDDLTAINPDHGRLVPIRTRVAHARSWKSMTRVSHSRSSGIAAR